MHCRLETKSPEEIRSSNIVQQTSFWAEVKKKQGLCPFAFNYIASNDLLHPSETEDHSVVNDLLVLVKFLSNDSCFAYIPYGPKDEPDFENYGVFLEELSEVLRPYLPGNCIFIRYDLPWENQWAKEDDFYDENGNWKGAPPAINQEFRLNFNTHYWNLIKSQSDILPSNTIFLNLNQSEQNLLKRMKPKTRYNIRLSLRKGISVKAYGLDKLDEWYSLYRETAIRNNINLHEKSYFRSVIANQHINNNQDIDLKMIMASHNDQFLAAMFLILSRKRGTYLFGASSTKSRNMMATYALQWEAIRLAQKNGCEEYDMFGVAPNPDTSHPMYGLYRFKCGFGGSIFHRMGCWDYPLNPDEYKIFRAKEVNAQKYHKN